MVIVVLLLAILLTGCGLVNKSPNVAQLTEEFVYSSLAFSPIAATAAGYHEHGGARLDEQLDDWSETALARQRDFYRKMRERSAAAWKASSDAEDKADLAIIDDQISLALLELETIKNYRHNPTLYVEAIGNALFSPYTLEYAPKPERYRHIIARLQKIPAFLDQARANLADSPEIWNRVAQAENDGNIGLIELALKIGLPGELRADYERAAATALTALRGFNQFLRDDLSKRTSDWRLGKANYAAKFRYALATDKTPEQVLRDAEADLDRIRRDMHQHASKGQGELNAAVSGALDKIARKHSTPLSYFADAARDLEDVRGFVRAKGLLALPPRDNLKVIETPEFMRGIYAVGGFNAAPALEPQLGAYYWLTPIPANWPAARIESKLREYNYFGLKLLTIHEAIPGHYVQIEYANDVQPKGRRLLRSIFGNGAYVEGWAVYATQLVLDEGYLDNSPELRLTFEKQQLRMLANTILDVRMQTMGMTDQQALDLMIKDTFQETEEATAKLQRAKLSSVQLPTYYVGWRDWLRVREQYRSAKGAAFSLSEFHERALCESAVPLPVLARLLGVGIAP